MRGIPLENTIAVNYWFLARKKLIQSEPVSIQRYLSITLSVHSVFNCALPSFLHQEQFPTEIIFSTSMHSSGMRTARLLTVSQHALRSGGVSQHALGRGCVSQHALGRGVSTQGGARVSAQGGGGGVCLGVSTQGSVCPGGGHTPSPDQRQTPPTMVFNIISY